jgi:hypothetical protein
MEENVEDLHTHTYVCVCVVIHYSIISWKCVEWNRKELLIQVNHIGKCSQDVTSRNIRVSFNNVGRLNNRVQVMKTFMNDTNKADFFRRIQKQIVGVLITVVYIRALRDRGGGREWSSRPLTSSGWRQ